MSQKDTISYVTLAYKIAALLVGLLCIYFGFRLFEQGVFGASGDLSVAAGKSRLDLQNAAPGTLFALFGAIVVAFTVHRGLRLHSQSGSGSNSADVDKLLKDFASQDFTYLDSLVAGKHLTRKQANKIRDEFARVITLKRLRPEALLSSSTSAAAAADAPAPAPPALKPAPPLSDRQPP